jgi:hypothetical protein
MILIWFQTLYIHEGAKWLMITSHTILTTTFSPIWILIADIRKTYQHIVNTYFTFRVYNLTSLSNKSHIRFKLIVNWNINTFHIMNTKLKFISKFCHDMIKSFLLTKLKISQSGQCILCSSNFSRHSCSPTFWVTDERGK